MEVPEGTLLFVTLKFLPDRIPPEEAFKNRYMEFAEGPVVFNAAHGFGSFSTRAAPFRVNARVLVDGTLDHERSYVEYDEHKARHGAPHPAGHLTKLHYR